MLTSLYSIIAIMKSLLFGDFGSLSDWYRQRSLLLGILGRLAQAKRIPLSVPEVAKLFGVTPKTVYKNIKRNEALAAKIQEMLKALAGCILVPRRNVDKTICSWHWMLMLLWRAYSAYWPMFTMGKPLNPLAISAAS